MTAHSQIVIGWHAVEAALRDPAASVEAVYLNARRQDRRSRALDRLAKQRSVLLESVPAERLDALASGVNHQGVVAVLSAQAPPAELDDLLDGLEAPFLLILDGVQDPHNLGACLRTADAAGVDAVIVPKDRAAGMTPAVRKVAAGAADRVPLHPVTNLARCLQDLKQRNIWVIGADEHAEQSLFAADLTGALALVLGAEGRGLRRLTRQHCDLLVHIPMAGTVASLNVSVAAGVCLYEALRQRTSAA